MVIEFKLETDPRAFVKVHDGVATLSRNCSFSEVGRSPKKRSSASRKALVSPLSKLAPAKKSAQIISRQ